MAFTACLKFFIEFTTNFCEESLCKYLKITSTLKSQRSLKLLFKHFYSSQQRNCNCVGRGKSNQIKFPLFGTALSVEIRAD
jgi:hypothetical protein